MYSRMEGMEFFEGTEKLMEVWWSPVLGDDGTFADLRTVSSMFVSRERLILKTCGQTTLLCCIKPLLELAKIECGLSNVRDFFYSRMNYQAPNLQSIPHQTFDQELFYGQKCFRFNGWISCFQYILMLDLDKETMNKFYKSLYSDADEVTEVTGIANLLPGAVIDAALFDPCGYSANGLLSSCYKELIRKVLETFKPGRFLMTLFANEGAPCGFSYKTFQEGSIAGYKCNDLQLSQMKMYNLTYGHYEKMKELKVQDNPNIC
ncbi:S-adenosylmethionine decarboxylase proenzyme [Acropora cervicornis]|uniref:S-adenosylmethionine decarboxylase proenzyme n=1 Tax=Acropora cervicornis TaxID=6130 RepID=A0AAD9VDS8_ACRCE|nr:S-adenosylmethionine decarboxylase proenzyme [Acropora cervicornis]